VICGQCDELMPLGAARRSRNSRLVMAATLLDGFFDP
jgi:hypothetical protein